MNTNKRLKKILESDGIEVSSNIISKLNTKENDTTTSSSNKSVKKLIYKDLDSCNVPTQEELALAKFVEKNKDLPVLKGAYDRCNKNNLIISKDRLINSTFISNSIYTFFTFQISLYCIYKYNNFVAIFKNKYKYTPFFILGSLLSALNIGYIYYKFNRDLDIKYSPVWIKSKDSLLKKSHANFNVNA